MPSQKPANGGYVYREGVSANTRLLNTQKVRLFAIDADVGKSAQIGLVQTWNPTQTRNIEPQRGIGFGDQIAELAVGNTDLNATCSVMMMYLKDIMQIFGYKAGSSGFVRALKHHRWPFDVKESIVLPKWIMDTATGTSGLTSEEGGPGDSGSVILTNYEGCWMSDYSKAFNIGDTATTQDTTIQITNVYANNFDESIIAGEDAGNRSVMLNYNP